MPFELLSNQDMAHADALTIKAGVAGSVLMERAGTRVAATIKDRFECQRTLILCGPGNNGGDGYVVARLLQDAGWPVRVVYLGDAATLGADAFKMREQWRGNAEPLTLESTDFVAGSETLVVDALFGAGLSRPVRGVVAEVVERLNASEVSVVSVDVPTGLDDFGRVLGNAVRADLTITFFRKKPVHLLFPGRELCGEVILTDIGIDVSVLAELRPAWCQNTPIAWRKVFPKPKVDGHKYQRGHAVVVSGPVASGGAARLAARSALRVGAGLVSVACPADAVVAHASQLNAVMVLSFEEFEEVLADERKNSIVIGPGNGAGEQTRCRVLSALASRRSCVLDADALTAFQAEPSLLFEVLHERCVLTPHDGEFARLFPQIASGSRLERAVAAAQCCGAVVVLKGPDTVVANPQGHATVNANAPPSLATAGSGDVLAGLVGGLLAQSMPVFEAASAAVWLHGRAATLFGPGLIAEDLPDVLPSVLAEFVRDEMSEEGSKW